MRKRLRICVLEHARHARGAALVAACAVVVAVALAAGPTAASAAPAQQTAAQNDSTSGQQDLFGSLDAADPFCNDNVKLPGGGTISKSAATNCKVSKSAAEPYPINSYGLDVQTPSANITAVWNWIGFAFESVCAWIWEVTLYLIRGVLLLLQWAYTLPLLSGSMPGIQKGLAVLHKNVFGTSWLVAALGVLGLWGIWNGLVRRKTIETVGGLLTTLAMMIAALVLIAQPHYIGTLAGYTDSAALTTLSEASKAQVSPNASAASPVAPNAAAQNTGSGAANGVVTSEGNLFTSLVLEPWCALEFGDVGYCLAPHEKGVSVADVWLSFPANSAPRQSLYKLATTGQSSSTGQKVSSWLRFGWDIVSGSGHNPFDDLKDLRNPQWCPSSSNCPELDVAKKYIYLSGNKNNSRHVQIQGGNSNVFDRMTLLAMVLIGIAGALCVLVWITIKLLFASAKVILLILGLPVMLLVSAFGESGRSTVGSYFKRLLGSLITKLILSIFLAIVLLTYNVLQGVVGHKGAPSWFSLQLIMILFWWGVFLERKVVLQFLEVNSRAVDRGADVSGAQAPLRMTSMLMGGFAVGRLVRGGARAVRAPIAAAQRRSFANRTARAGAVRELTQQELTDRAAAVIRGESQARAATARTAIARHGERDNQLTAWKAEQGQIRRQLGGINRRLENGTMPDATRQALEQRRDRLQDRADDLANRIGPREAALRRSQPQINEHRRFLAQMQERNPAEDPRERQRAVDQRRADVSDGVEFPSDRREDRPRLERSLRWAGQDPAEFDTATPERRDEMLREARTTFDADRQRFSRVDSPAARDGLPLGSADARAARRELRNRPGGEARYARAEQQHRRTEHDRSRRRRLDSRGRRG